MIHELYVLFRYVSSHAIPSLTWTFVVSNLHLVGQPKSINSDLAASLKTSTCRPPNPLLHTYPYNMQPGPMWGDVHRSIGTSKLCLCGIAFSSFRLAGNALYSLHAITCMTSPLLSVLLEENMYRCNRKKGTTAMAVAFLNVFQKRVLCAEIFWLYVGAGTVNSNIKTDCQSLF